MWTGAKHDQCKIGTLTASSAPEPSPSSYTYGSAIACRFVEKESVEIRNGTQAVIGDAVIYVPAGTSVTAANRVQLTKRNGVAQSSKYYKIVKDPKATNQGFGYGSSIGDIRLICKSIAGNAAK